MNILRGDTKTVKGKGLLTVLAVTPYKTQKANGSIAQIVWGTNGMNPNCATAYTQNVFPCGGLGRLASV